MIKTVTTSFSNTNWKLFKKQYNMHIRDNPYLIRYSDIEYNGKSWVVNYTEKR